MILLNNSIEDIYELSNIAKFKNLNIMLLKLKKKMSHFLFREHL